MRDNRGITLITVIITVVLLIIIVGLAIGYSMDNYNNSKVIKFETYMRAIQKKVDVMLEEGVDYNSIGSALSNDVKTSLASIINSNANIVTRDAEEPKLRYLSPADIEHEFDLIGISDEIIVNFANRDIISLNGVEKENVFYYTLYTLP